MDITTKRLEILKLSLNKKNTEFDIKLNDHFQTVKASNGQPLNDKRNGKATLVKWERQNVSLRNSAASIKKTEDAIERERAKIAKVQQYAIPELLQKLIEDGVIAQWRKHPRFFFVRGVEKARIVVREDGVIVARYARDIPTAEQYAIFRDIFNGIKNVNRGVGEI